MKDLRNTILAATCLLSLVAGARPGYLRKFQTQYPEAKVLADMKCALCHNEATMDLNAFGHDVGLNYAANGKKIVWEQLEPIDSDGDAYTNLEEIKAGTHPGDRNSKPAGH